MKALEGRSARWFGPVSESIVTAAEEELGVPIPADYRRFLLDYGSGSVGPLEIYGLGGTRTCVPSLLWLVGELKKTGLHRPSQLLPFYAEGDGDYSAVLAAPLAGQPTGAIVYWSPRRDDVLDIRPANPSLEAWFIAALS